MKSFLLSTFVYLADYLYARVINFCMMDGSLSDSDCNPSVWAFCMHCYMWGIYEGMYLLV